MNFEEPIGQPVRSLQTMLRRIAQAEPDVSPVVPDGIYSKDTQRAVSDVQRLHGLPITGIADAETWRAVVRSYHEAVSVTAPANPLQIRLDPMQVIRTGEANNHLYLVQAMLLVLGKSYQNFPVVVVTGVLDAPTGQALQILQAAAGIPVTGQLDLVTYAYLTDLYRLTTGNGSHAAQSA
ncbi:MAG: peptidoglycan-binding domain-containing protein [Oscillospiraceae bacterium]|nr:peptidoglycan-binding domain-containing protein [Oscillospiraceae bacterium]